MHNPSAHVESSKKLQNIFCITAAHTRPHQAGGTRKHMGLDIVCTDGDTVLAPFHVKINGPASPYTTGVNAAINDGLNLSGQGLCFKLFYVKPVETSGTVEQGQELGTMLPMQEVYPGITSHVHVQMCNKSDPTKYF
ncbi:leukocyte cell-derived chemotaxin-2-like [Scleropages formosus]|uniref:leukocyte cell-derived chemotaxin-2-like n=1 Tax=Scleropages formosus TaxID=113540 RepID=UPI0010FA810A|nr:leukocyte cell-derived chemotaxin-2-like [Scleropages formosus]